MRSPTRWRRARPSSSRKSIIRPEFEVSPGYQAVTRLSSRRYSVLLTILIWGVGHTYLDGDEEAEHRNIEEEEVDTGDVKYDPGSDGSVAMILVETPSPSTSGTSDGALTVRTSFATSMEKSNVSWRKMMYDVIVEKALKKPSVFMTLLGMFVGLITPLRRVMAAVIPSSSSSSCCCCCCCCCCCSCLLPSASCVKAVLTHLHHDVGAVYTGVPSEVRGGWARSRGKRRRGRNDACHGEFPRPSFRHDSPIWRLHGGALACGDSCGSPSRNLHLRQGLRVESSGASTVSARAKGRTTRRSRDATPRLCRRARFLDFF
eukprot:scaffold1828_cov258-Pinguiococcus_pyrenoidosus.AAC.8